MGTTLKMNKSVFKLKQSTSNISLVCKTLTNISYLRKHRQERMRECGERRKYFTLGGTLREIWMSEVFHLGGTLVKVV